MTTAHTEERTPTAIVIDVLKRPATMDRESAIACRRDAFLELDGAVRAELRRLASLPFGSSIDCTIYDAVYAGMPDVGGHWTIASRWMGLVMHTVSSYAVSLCFDAENRPSHFVISGSREVRTTDASVAALSHGIEQAGAHGPLRTTAPHVFQGFAL